MAEETIWTAGLLYKWFACSGQEQEGGEGGQQSRALCSPTDTTSSLVLVHQPQVQQLFVCVVLAAAIPSQEQRETWTLGLLLSPAANQQPGPRH